MARRLDWSLVDWSLSDTALAALMGCSASGVWRARQRLTVVGEVKRKKRKIDWDKVDWSLPTSEIARLLNVRMSHVSGKRRKLGKPLQRSGPQRKIKRSRGPYKDNAARRARLLAVRNNDNRKATAAARESLRAGRGENNVHAKTWRLVSPDGAIYGIINLQHFVRTHPELFDPADVAWKRTGGKRGTGGEYCNATAGIQNIRARKTTAWKGWKLAD